MLPRPERLFFALLQRDCRSSGVHSPELHPAPMAALETAQAGAGGDQPWPVEASAQPAQPIPGHLLRTCLYPNALGELLPGVIGNRANKPSQGPGQTPAPGRELAHAAGKCSCSPVSIAWPGCTQN